MNEIKGDLKRKIVILTLTENCNLDCIYCFEKAKTKKLMVAILEKIGWFQ